MKRSPFRKLVLILAAASSCSSDPDSFRVAHVFSDNMVLQRDASVPLWGWARPGQKVSVKLAGKTASGTADAQGAWRVDLGPLPAGGPHELLISGAGDVVFKNVLVGDVFLCAGASNMEWPVASSRDAAKEMEGARFPGIRHLIVPKGSTREPLADLPPAVWQECRPETVGTWSATGFYFARSLHKKLGVPIGLVNATWGATTCEAWTSAKALESLPEFKDLLARRSAGKGAPVPFEERLTQWRKTLEGLDQGSLPGKKSWADPALNDTAWKKMELPQYWEKSELPAFDGVVWFRKTVIVPSVWAGRDMVLNLGPIDDDDVTYWNGVRIGATEGWNTPRSYGVPASEVKAGPNLIAIRVNDKGGGGGLHGAPAQLMLEGPGIPLAGAWSYAVGMDLAQAPPPPDLPDYAGNPTTPAGHFNGMIAPIIPFGIKGAIWYQGEANVGSGALYRTAFPLLIRDWRSRWGQGNFPFHFVQLANHKAPAPTPGDSPWADLREAQALALSQPNTGMAVAIDIGEAGELHPANKQDVGDRLAQGLLVSAYGVKGPASGPLFESTELEEKRIRIRFKQAEGGLVARDGPLKGFSIAGEDRRWEWAEARIEGDSVVVSSPKIAKPAWVRYAWADNPQGCNLYDKEGLPAPPFRTDP